MNNNKYNKTFYKIEKKLNENKLIIETQQFIKNEETILLFGDDEFNNIFKKYMNEDIELIKVNCTMFRSKDTIIDELNFVKYIFDLCTEIIHNEDLIIEFSFMSSCWISFLFKHNINAIFDNNIVNTYSTIIHSFLTNNKMNVDTNYYDISAKTINANLNNIPFVRFIEIQNNNNKIIVTQTIHIMNYFNKIICNFNNSSTFTKGNCFCNPGSFLNKNNTLIYINSL